MKLRHHVAATFLFAGLVAGATGAEPTKAPELPPLTPEAEQTVQELRGSLPAGSEPIAMLESILEGKRLGPEDGWFKRATSQTRFPWSSAAQKYDSDGDAKITEQEFGGDAGDFTRIDRNGDRSLTEADFNWSEHSLTRTPGFQLFFAADADANGKVTGEEFTALLNRLDTDHRGYVALDELKDAFQPQPTANAVPPPDAPSRSTLIRGLKRQEIGSLQTGPAVGEVAPDFTLNSIDGEPVNLTSVLGQQPVVLIFGNFTCGPFRSQSGNIEKLYQRYKDRARIFLIYVREAHPSDGWWMASNERVGIGVPQPVTDADRLAVASTCRRHFGFDQLDLPFLVDYVDDRVGATYSGMPNRLYLIDREGRVAFKSGRGPFGFKPRELEQALLLLLNQ